MPFNVKASIILIGLANKVDTMPPVPIHFVAHCNSHAQMPFLPPGRVSEVLHSLIRVDAEMTMNMNNVCLVKRLENT